MSLSAYDVIRVVLRIWDALPNSANGETTTQMPQPAHEFNEVKSLLTLLISILAIFEVGTLSVR